MKKLITMIAMLVIAITANAQFQAGKGYIGASLTGFELNYNSANGFSLGAEAKAGFLFEDNWMLLGTASFQHYGSGEVPGILSFAAGARYYFIQNGLFLGANAKFVHANHSYDDVMPELELGYAFFINRSVTVEPSVYYDQSFKNSDYSTFGVKVGLGIYLFDD